MVFSYASIMILEKIVGINKNLNIQDWLPVFSFYEKDQNINT